MGISNEIRINISIYLSSPLGAFIYVVILLGGGSTFCLANCVNDFVAKCVEKEKKTRGVISHNVNGFLFKQQNFNTIDITNSSEILSKGRIYTVERCESDHHVLISLSCFCWKEMLMSMLNYQFSFL